MSRTWLTLSTTLVFACACGGGSSVSLLDGGEPADATSDSLVISLDGPVATDAADGGNADGSGTDGSTSDGSMTDSPKGDAPSEGGGSCEAGAVSCSGTCTDTSTDPNNCGSCGVKCPGLTNGSATCAAGTDGAPACGTMCNTGFIACSGQCLSTGDDPQSNPCLLSSTYGVFVAPSPQGADASGQGSPSAPFATVSYALAHLPAGVTDVFVCNGSYDDQVTITSSVSLYGGLSCTSNVWTVANPLGIASITSTGPGPALTINGVSAHIENMGFTAIDATGTDALGNGNSSIAAFVSSSTVDFLNVTLTAGNGANGNNGADGASTPNYTNGPVAPGGTAGSGTGSAVGGSNSCQNNDSSTGGGGGVPGTTSVAGGGGGGGGSSPAAMVSPPDDGDGGTAGTNTCTNGDPGAKGSARAGGIAATVYGALSPSGWIPSSGTNGGIGQPGEGGGGGGGLGGNLVVPIGGGGGGAGGCGGEGGYGGGGGGGSIGLASVGATVSLTACTLVTKTAGNGGNGGMGDVGQVGGPIGASTCNGGTGGNGAGGSGGAGGTGGISVGVLWSGAEPTGDSAATFTPGTAGISGQLGQPGQGGMNGGPTSPGNAGAAGEDGTVAQTLSP